MKSPPAYPIIKERAGVKEPKRVKPISLMLRADNNPMTPERKDTPKK